MADIVERLRVFAKLDAHFGETLSADAADLIEALRAENEALREGFFACVMNGMTCPQTCDGTANCECAELIKDWCDLAKQRKEDFHALLTNGGKR